MNDLRFFPDEPPYVGKSFFRPNGSIKFDPILTDQRYSFVVNLLSNSYWKERIRTVADFGCSDLNFFRVLRSLRFLRTAYLVDIDEEMLKNNRMRAQPINSDYINRRDSPFHVEILRGSVDFFSEKMINLDAFVAIELIEHLFPPELERLPYNVFHLIKPQIAIFTTPNSDFNILFATLPFNNFRHDDHKFEWSREQFQDWAENIVQRFPDYVVSLQGIGPGPEGAEEYGGCSQAAIFVRRPECVETQITPWEVQEYNAGARMQTYDVILECDFPHDERTREEKISDCAMYHINQIEHRSRMDRDAEQYDYAPFRLEIPLEKILGCVTQDHATTQQELEAILRGRPMQVENGNVVIVSDDEEMGDEEDYENY
ncbi:small RNA 2'-O-methyltransferase [Lutzomyia longipalpis]|uniref:small RNA 2'-O-methyltransferase n=1 Tax=Lutzomyia longipalpis TaxID=7200 RepID=UPI0024835A56|nr:small RNA 2'-O-methyltransferase [Lutzomyia longipalpis]